MAEKKGVGHAYNVDFLNVVFAASSLFLFLSVVWMVWDDYDREWKNTQRRFADLQYQVTQAQLQQATRAVDRSKLQALQQQLAAAEKNVAANQQKVNDLQKKLDDLNTRRDRVQRRANFAKANLDHDRYDFESSRVADPNSSSVSSKQQTVVEEQKQFEDLTNQSDKTIAERDGVQKDLAQYTGQVGTLG